MIPAHLRSKSIVRRTENMVAELRGGWQINSSTLSLILELEETVAATKSGFLHATQHRICPVIVGMSCASQCMVRFYLFKEYAVSIKINRMTDNITHLKYPKDLLISV